MSRRALALVVLVIGLLVAGLAGCGGDGSPAPDDGPGQAREGTRDLDEINASLPEGYTAEVAAQGLVYGTAIGADGEGGLYMGALEDGDTRAVHRLRDPDGDGTFDEVTRFAEVESLVSGFLARPDGSVYVSIRGSILDLRDEDGDGTADAQRAVVSGLPVSPGINVHSLNGIVPGPDGKLYFGLGSVCNDCDPEDPRSATVMRCEITGAGCEVFADGIRNAWDIAFDPRDGSLWGGDNQPDPIDATPAEYDEVDLIQEGHDYGYPGCYGIGGGTDCSSSDPPALELEQRAAPAGVAFITSAAAPAEFRNDLLVTLWGGRRIIRLDIPTPGSAAGVTASDFVAMDRPVDIVEEEGGGLLVLDGEAGTIYRISPEG